MKKENLLSVLLMAIVFIECSLTGCGLAKKTGGQETINVISAKEYAKKAESRKDKDNADNDKPQNNMNGEIKTDGKTLEDCYEYEICRIKESENNDTQKDGLADEYYAVIKGFRGDFGEDFAAKIKKLTQSYYYFTLPETLEGVVVKEIAPNAFQNVDLGSCFKAISLPSGVVSVGKECFRNCGVFKIELAGDAAAENDLGEFSESVERREVIVGDRAFADNPDLWGIWLDNAAPSFGREVFAGCSSKQYLCYRVYRSDYETEPCKALKQLETYATENGMEAVEIPDYCSDVPLIRYPKEPYTLTAEVKNFFYGESADDELFCAFTYDDDAPDFGFPEWHIPCGEFCAMSGGKYEITASSELASQDGRYAAKNLIYDRETAWAEGAADYGIGESIRITSGCSYSDKWDGEVFFYEGDIEPDVFDGYMRYTKICVVNGYAKNRETWEENSRVKRMLLYVEDAPYAYLELEDTIRPQYFSLPINDIKAANGVDVHFEFVIEDIYPGTKYEDTCLTGLVVEFMGRHGH